MTFDAQLGKQLKFTKADLEANRAGNLSDDQWQKHMLDIYVGVGTVSIFAIIFILMGIIALFEYFIAGVIVIGIGIGLAFMAHWYYRVKQKVKTVHSLTGQVIGIETNPRMGRTLKTTDRNFYIAHRTFLVPHLPKRTFTFYYIEPNDLLSAEEVTPDNILEEILASTS